MAPFSQELEPPQNPGRFTDEELAELKAWEATAWERYLALLKNPIADTPRAWWKFWKK
jgi:hypothetical protein